MNIERSLALLLVANLLEDVMGPADIADQYMAWTLQRGGSGYDQSTFNAWMRHWYPENIAQAEEIFKLVRKQAAA